MRLPMMSVMAAALIVALPVSAQASSVAPTGLHAQAGKYVQAIATKKMKPTKTTSAKSKAKPKSKSY